MDAVLQRIESWILEHGKDPLLTPPKRGIESPILGGKRPKTKKPRNTSVRSGPMKLTSRILPHQQHLAR